MHIHTTPRVYSASNGTIPESAVDQIAQYLRSLVAMLTSIGQGRPTRGYCYDRRKPHTLTSLPPYPIFAGHIERLHPLLPCSGTTTYNHTIRRYLRNLGADLYIPDGTMQSCLPSLHNWAQGPTTTWESNREKSLKQWYQWLADRIPQHDERLHDTDRTSTLIKNCGLYWQKPNTPTFPRRLSRLLKKEYGIQLSSTHLAAIGTIAKSSMIDLSSVILTFDRDYLRGRSEDYGNPGSCWWGDCENARHSLHENGGYAIRHWASEEDGEELLSRCWCAPYGNCWVIFNAYGDLSLDAFAIVLSEHNDLAYRRISLYCDDHDEFYINSNRGIVIGPAEEVERYRGGIDLGYVRDDSQQCEACGHSVDFDCCYVSDNGGTYCKDCYYDLFARCDDCNCEVTRDDVVAADNEDWLCFDCADGCEQCWSCDRPINGLEHTTIDGIVCDACFREYSRCPECERFVHAIFGAACHDCNTAALAIIAASA